MLIRLHRDLPADLLDQFQIINTRVRDLDPERKRVLWVHDTELDPEVQHLGNVALRARFDGLVFVSHHQRSLFCQRFDIPHGRTRVIPNAVEEFDVDASYFHREGDPVRLIFHTTPHRGLDILVREFAKIVDEGADVLLDVYSSFEIYGWPQRDVAFKEVFDFCREHPRIRYHGFKENSVVREALRTAHVFAYPSVWQETSCISAIEALCAGCYVLTSDLGALPETIGKWGRTYPFTEDRELHGQRFGRELRAAIAALRDGLKNHLAVQAQQANLFYSWGRDGGSLTNWKTYLEELT